MSDNSYYAKKKQESDKKIQEALKAREARTAKEETSQTSFAEKKNAGDSKVQAALDSRSQSSQSSLPSVYSDIEKLLAKEIDSYNST